MRQSCAENVLPVQDNELIKIPYHTINHTKTVIMC